jgi:TonB family protein
MSAGVAQAPVRTSANTRRFPRFPLSVPADITVLRSGIPYTIPGRSITLGEGGLGAVLAGELRAGDPVGLEFRLPESNGRLRLKAVVRYQALLQCGLEFVNLTSEQQTLIEHWTRRKSGLFPQTLPPVETAQLPVPLVAALPVTTPTVVIAEPELKRRNVIFRPVLCGVLAATLVAVGFGWWYWHQAWSELESQVSPGNTFTQLAPTIVPSEVMEKFITHKIEPIYPESARQANLQGVVVLETIIGTDGNVANVRAISGSDELATAAMEAVKWWRFQPYLVNGQAVRVKTTLAVEFR